MPVKIAGSKRGLGEAVLTALERKLGIELPEEYRRFLLLHNGGKPAPAGFHYEDETGQYTDSQVDRFLSVHEGKLANFADDFITYKVDEKRMPDRLVPIATDPGGNVVCISVAGRDRGAIYFWDHEHEMDAADEEEGEPGESNVHLIADSFGEFLALLSDEDAPPQPPKSPIRQLIEADDLDGVRRLLDEGYDVESKDDAWGTAAEVAALLNKPEALGLLLERGAAAAPAFGDALAQGRLEILKMLLPRGVMDADLQFALFTEHVYEDVELVRMLIAAGADVNRVMPGKAWKTTPLHWAADSGNAAAVKCLLEHRAKAGVPDGLQRIPLHYGVQQRDPEVARLLILAGEDLYAKDHGGYAPLDLVKGRAAKRRLESIAGG